MAQQVNEWLIALAVAFIRPLSLSLLLPLLKSGSLGSAILRNGVLMSLTFSHITNHLPAEDYDAYW
ncbi:type III secretion system protein SsaT [Salmonella enterica subsp. enterica]|nr:type III secretion system protein SsaT [Salmonella enterica subsp. enterica]